MEYNNLICYFFCGGAGGAREYVVLVRWKNPCVCTVGTLTVFLTAAPATAVIVSNKQINY